MAPIMLWLGIRHTGRSLTMIRFNPAHRIWRCLWPLVLALAVTADVSSAHAARMAVITRGVGAGAEKAATFTGHYVHDLLAKDERYEVIDLSKVLGNQDRDKALHAFAAAEELVQKGRQAYDTLELDAAVDNLNSALLKYERFAAYVDDFKKVSEALMLLGATHILRGEDKLGAKRLEQAVNINPQIEPDPRIFNPAMRSIFQESAARVSSRQPGSLTLTSNPGFSAVYVDGRFVGVTMMGVEHVSEGRHYVRLEKDGLRPFGKVMEVVGKTETAENAFLRPTSHFDEFDQAAEAAVKHLPPPGKSDGKNVVTDPIEALATLTQADQVFLTVVRLNGERVQVWAYQYDLVSRRLLKSVEHVFSYDTRPETYDREVGAMLQTDFAVDSLLSSGNGGGDKKRRDKEVLPVAEDVGLAHAGDAHCAFDMACDNFKVLITAIGAGVGLTSAVVGGVYWGFAKRDHDQWLSVDQASAASGQLSAEGRSYALRGDVLIGVGAGLLLASGLVYLLWDPQPSTLDVLGESDVKARLDLTPQPGGGMFGLTLNF